MNEGSVGQFRQFGRKISYRGNVPWAIRKPISDRWIISSRQSYKFGEYRSNTFLRRLVFRRLKIKKKNCSEIYRPLGRPGVGRAKWWERKITPYHHFQRWIQLTTEVLEWVLRRQQWRQYEQALSVVSTRPVGVLSRPEWFVWRTVIVVVRPTVDTTMTTRLCISLLSLSLSLSLSSGTTVWRHTSSIIYPCSLVPTVFRSSRSPAGGGAAITATDQVGTVLAFFHGANLGELSLSSLINAGE